MATAERTWNLEDTNTWQGWPTQDCTYCGINVVLAGVDYNYGGTEYLACVDCNDAVKEGLEREQE